MDFSTWVVLVGVVGMAVAGVCWKRRARHIYVINHVRVEMHPACVVEDRLIEVVWRAAISMSSASRRPRTLPVFAERATVRAGRRQYLASIYLDEIRLEINPGEVQLAWVELVLPSGSVPKEVDAIELRRGSHDRRVRWATVDGKIPRGTLVAH